MWPMCWTLTVSEAADLFSADREVIRVYCKPIVDVGLEYVKLGQPVPTLSGGEAQRLKLGGLSGRGCQRRAAASKQFQATAKRGCDCSCWMSLRRACTLMTLPS